MAPGGSAGKGAGEKCLEGGLALTSVSRLREVSGHQRGLLSPRRSGSRRDVSRTVGNATRGILEQKRLSGKAVSVAAQDLFSRPGIPVRRIGDEALDLKPFGPEKLTMLVSPMGGEALAKGLRVRFDQGPRTSR